MHTEDIMLQSCSISHVYRNDIIVVHMHVVQYKYVDCA